MNATLFSARVHGCRVNLVTWRGLEVLTIENDVIRVGLLLTKGADLIELRYKPLDLDVFWHNPLAWPPRALNWRQTLDGRGSFLDTLHGGWQVSIPNGFFPTDYFGAPIGIHGDLALQQWDLTGATESDEEASLRVETKGLHCPFRMERTLRVRSHQPVVYWSERLTNLSPMRLPLMWSHHASFGGPLIQQGARLIARARGVRTPPADRPELAELRADAPSSCSIGHNAERQPRRPAVT